MTKETFSKLELVSFHANPINMSIVNRLNFKRVNFAGTLMNSFIWVLKKNIEHVKSETVWACFFKTLFKLSKVNCFNFLTEKFLTQWLKILPCQE